MKSLLLLCLVGVALATPLIEEATGAPCKASMEILGQSLRTVLHNPIERRATVAVIVKSYEVACTKKHCGPCDYGIIDCIKAQAYTSKLVITPANCCSHCSKRMDKFGKTANDEVFR
ncbi:unnamed protein product [Bursaphelenchus xylophilus]|uniref:(pine wood nematode) hypothetical protein n=1 Tax=Bursaphelenchus xylophilus TaxID=6326 RepID=A0A1I7RYU5_BURXY|nr:unnamed protein product [Bursaphelenchus xylophilus]CAG9092213.1 unnamed protein product [Bursaphelenchus xylophilus]